MKTVLNIVHKKNLKQFPFKKKVTLLEHMNSKGSDHKDSRSRIHEPTLFVEVSGHNLESSQTWGFCMDFLKHREGGISLNKYVRGCVRLKKYKSQGKALEVTVNRKEENS